jgi:DNA-binding NtrC family response regulator
VSDQVPAQKLTLVPDRAERKPTILVVDDEPLIRMAVSDFLQECGFKVLEASSADEAVQMLRSYAMVIDVVFSDVIMPGEMDGFALATWVRRTYPAIPVLLCSGDTKKTAAAKEMCADAPFFAKPYDLEAVVGAIRAALSKPKSN